MSALVLVARDLTYVEKGQQRTWDHIPIKETACGKNKTQRETFIGFS